MKMFKKPIRFQWDKGNEQKNQIKHDVTNQEAEEVFNDPRKRIYNDTSHSDTEPRHILIGRTKNHRVLFIVFTTRNEKIRVISARDLNKRKETNLYEKTT